LDYFDFNERGFIKDVRTLRGVGVCPVRVLQMRTSALFDAKNFAFFETYGVSARTRGDGVEAARTFFGQGE